MRPLVKNFSRGCITTPWKDLLTTTSLMHIHQSLTLDLAYLIGDHRPTDYPNIPAVIGKRAIIARVVLERKLKRASIRGGQP